MDQNKNTQGQQDKGQQDKGQQQKQNPPNQGQQQGSRDKEDWNAEGSRDKSRSNMGSEERGTGSQSEKNRSGISNRGMSPDEEQVDLPRRGSSDDDFQSER